jgi:ribonuclease BN (tRNA processing enzyme)
MKRFTAELWQNGVKVASVDCPDEDSMNREIVHYTLIYAEDGPVKIVISGDTRPKSRKSE